MERYFKRRFASTTSSSDNVGSSISRDVDNSKESELQDILANLIADLGLRPQMLDYDPNIRDEVRRVYLQKGPCQPKDHTFPQTDLSAYDRRFNIKWFDEFDWLEYSISKDAAFCLYCYLFKSNFRIGQGCSNAFTEICFRNWKKKDKIRQHVGPVRTSLDCVRFLLRQGLPFRGHDESDTSSNKRNYLELLQFFADYDEKVNTIVLENAPGNLKLIAPTIQKYIVNACATETIKKIIKDMDALVVVAKGNADIATFFTSCNSLVNIVGVSCKRCDMLRDQLQKDIKESLEKDTVPTGRGLNQETCLKHPGDTHWNSHYGILLSIISMFKSAVKVLKLIIEDGSTDNLGEANRSLGEIKSFEFVFHLFFIRSILGATNDLSQALEKKTKILGMQ
ncbi:hypothetical protein L3X38_041289 [Prunus dulcis]|uniref:TTF-type domain-containing protein n=1 Tax=Prunus dulcis TaxID=3755 RepID=A0AAD4UU36_PRUDU|nr:hypothetical protein L3X38_041289 [Prunus dulcis]